MKTNGMMQVRVGFAFLLLSGAATAGEFRIEELREPKPANGPSIPLVTAKDPFWESGKPVWEETSLDISVKCWIATTKQAIRFHVVIGDPVHSNEFHERTLWMGDCIYISLDARGDTAPESLGRDPFDELDDAAYVFGLGKAGPEGYTVKHGQPEKRESSQTRLVKGIVRDEKQKTTTYDIVIPFSEVSSARWQSSRIGVAIAVAHKNKDKKDTNWGRIVAGKDKPRQLHALALTQDASPFATAAAKRTRLGAAGQEAQIVLAVQTNASVIAAASHGNQNRTL